MVGSSPTTHAIFAVPYSGRNVSHEKPAASSSSAMWWRTPREACALNRSKSPTHRETAHLDNLLVSLAAGLASSARPLRGGRSAVA